MTVLPDEDHLFPVGQGDHIRPGCRLQDDEIMLLARAGGDRTIRPEVEDPERSVKPTGDEGPGSQFHAGSIGENGSGVKENRGIRVNMPQA